MAAQNSRRSAPGKPFAKGKSGNPGGRPKKDGDLAAKIREMDERLRARLEHIALQGKHKDSVPAIKLLWAYGHGLPRQVITAEDGKGAPAALIILPTREDA